jgi:hypothetical protein
MPTYLAKDGLNPKKYTNNLVENSIFCSNRYSYKLALHKIFMITEEMKLNIDDKLKNTRNLLRELGNSVSSLVNSSPDIFEDPGIKSCLKEFLAVYQEAVQRLENHIEENSYPVIKIER